MPMIPELAMTMLACARIGAVHSIVFAGFSSESLRGRIEDCGSQFVFTADEGKRGRNFFEMNIYIYTYKICVYLYIKCVYICNIYVFIFM